MSCFFWILMTIVIAVDLGQPKNAEATTCCLTKKVDGITYTLISHRDTSSYNCLTDCIYKTNELGSLYCFGSGTEESECITTTTSTATTTTTVTATATTTTTTSTTTTTTATSTTTTTSSSSTTDVTVGILIAGGHGTASSAELFLPHTGKTCFLQDPPGRWGHSLDAVGNKTILCGGGLYGSPVTCFQFLQTSSTGSWVNYGNLRQGRYRHTSHVFKGEKDALMLIGGHLGPATTEIHGIGRQYDLEQDTYEACSIPDQSTYILTGGKNSESGWLKTVAIYDIKEFVENLPDLPKARGSHGCGFYMDKTNTKVLVVAGGEGNDGYLSSTELLPSGATSWISGEPLPRILSRMPSVTMDNYILLIGGHSGGNRREIFMFNGNWSVVGNMKNARYVHAATKIQVEEELDISVCL